MTDASTHSHTRSPAAIGLVQACEAWLERDSNKNPALMTFIETQLVMGFMNKKSSFARLISALSFLVSQTREGEGGRPKVLLDPWGSRRQGVCMWVCGWWVCAVAVPFPSAFPVRVHLRRISSPRPAPTVPLRLAARASATSRTGEMMLIEDTALAAHGADDKFDEWYQANSPSVPPNMGGGAWCARTSCRACQSL